MLRLLSALVLAACSLATQAVEWTHQGYVSNVSDGDTLALLDRDHREHRVRLDGIDAPERDQPYGREAWQLLRDLTYGLDVVAHCHKIDRYGRDICQVIAGGKDVGQEVLRAGLAWAFTRYLGELPAERRASYQAAEARAKAQKSGLWGDAREPVPPWEWRKGERATPAE